MRAAVLYINGQLAKEWMRVFLCLLVVCLSNADEDATYGFFKLVHSEVVEHNGDVKFLTKELFKPYMEFCSKVDFCDEALEFVRNNYVQDLLWRLSLLDQAELVLSRLKQKIEAN